MTCPPAQIGIVVPVFRHSGLVVEALASLQRQENAPAFAAVMVNDGCSFMETDRVCAGFSLGASGHPLHYVKRHNGGLSAARNTGIAFLLSRYPDIEAIYFLDADNRLQPYALARMAQALAAHPAADWFYPDLDMFGLNVVTGYAGEYSGLLHTSANISEAGSLVRRRVFDAGVRFDEEMRQGYEDWDFWLGARAKGFVGRHASHLGFLYRKRPESMLSDSHRDDSEIKGYMRRKRRSAFKVQNLLKQEASEAPRYAIVLDGRSVALAVDPRHPTEIISLDEFTRRFWRWLLRPDIYFTPPFMAFLSRRTHELLCDAGTVNWMFWDLEARLRDRHFSAAKLGPFAKSGAEITREEDGDLSLTLEAHIVLVGVDLVRAVSVDSGGGDWWTGLMSDGSGTLGSMRTVAIQDDRVETLPARTAMMNMFQIISELSGSEFREAAKVEWRWARSGIPERHTAYKAVRTAVNGSVAFPVKPDGRRHVGVLLSFADFGGVEKVAFNTARELREAGFIPHLVLFRIGDIFVPPRLRDVFESFLWVTSDGMLRWDGDEFNGTRLTWWSQHGDRTDVIGMLAWFDAVLNCQSGDAHGVMGELRRRGVLTLTHQHIVERSRAGRPVGSGILAKAFEHSYEAILTGSRLLKSWFIAHGVPQEKLFNVDNAPSYDLPSDVQDEIASERATRRLSDRPLRVLFGARFDVQKGLDRVVQLIERTAGLPISWRVVGKAIVDADENVERLATLAAIEPPVYTEDKLTDLYRWADVIVLPSRYEGVPLTVIEAMRCGAIMLAADAGGVSEVIRSGVDGFIVSQEACVDEMVELLRRLSGDEELCRSIAMAALDAGRSRSWKKSLSEVIALLDRKIPVEASTARAA